MGGHGGDLQVTGVGEVGRWKCPNGWPRLLLKRAGWHALTMDGESKPVMVFLAYVNRDVGWLDVASWRVPPQPPRLDRLKKWYATGRLSWTVPKCGTPFHISEPSRKCCAIISICLQAPDRISAQQRPEPRKRLAPFAIPCRALLGTK